MRNPLFQLLVCFVFLSPALQAQSVAFPGAEGFGRFATGGRSGKVIIVTNLNDDGPGSLRDAIQKKMPRIIVFAISGTIALSSPLDINNGDVTIAGQSALGDGICIRNYTVNVKADNVIIRFIRFRLGDEKRYEGDALSGTRGKQNIIIDHCSMSWSTDECASFYRNKNFTMQWCIISESLNHSIHSKGDHGYGGIWGGEGATFHHNLIASHKSRLPRFSGSASTRNGPDELVDFRNNVVYNWMDNSAYGGERGKYDFVNNYFKPGPATKHAGQILNPWSPYGQFYLSGNFLFGNEDVTTDNREGIKADDLDSVVVNAVFAVAPVETQSAGACFKDILANAGASFRRDPVDQRIVEEVKNGNSLSGKNKNGIIDSQKDVGGWPELKSLPAPADGDHDGMPDTWEKANSLNISDASDAGRKGLSNEYDNIEVYLNGLVKEIVEGK